MDRRRLRRSRPSTRQSLERALGSWVRLRDAWQLVFDGSRAVKNWERMALAESKLAECQSNIRRIRDELGERSAPPRGLNPKLI